MRSSSTRARSTLQPSWLVPKSFRYVDAHCHVDRYPSPPAVFAEAAAAGVVVVAVTELPSHFHRLSLRLGHRPLMRLALGVHPLRARDARPTELALFNRLLDDTDYVGEVGLDGSRHGRDSLPTQRKVFEQLLGQPRLRRKVLTVHSRGAEAEVIERLAASGVTVALHWYSGALKHIDAALDAGLWFSVNPAMIRSASGQRIIAALPTDRVVTETDGPWTKTGGRPCRPADMASLVVDLAARWGEDTAEARQRVLDNLAAMHSAATR
jgi:TatD DNase family protein